MLLKKQSRDEEFVNRFYVAAPCTADWDSMRGDERIRFCDQCKLNVYNISDMSTKDAAQLLRENEGGLCLKIYRRRDGTIITDNCPVGLRKARDQFRRGAILVIAAIAWLGLISSAQAQGLIGAPKDPVGYGMGSPPQPEVVVDKTATALCSAGILVAGLLRCLRMKKRGTLFWIGAILMIACICAGFVSNWEIKYTRTVPSRW